MISAKIKQYGKDFGAIRQIFELGEEMRKKIGAENVFDFSLGNPITEPPTDFSKVALELINNPKAGSHRYMRNAGYEDVCEFVAQNLKDNTGLDYKVSNICMTVGAAGALNVALKAILNPLDEVILLAPYFAEYPFYVDNHGGVIKICSWKEGFMPDLNKLESLITAKTKAIIINTPNNPSGMCYGRETLKDIADILSVKSAKLGTTIYTLSDEPYRNVIYGDTERVTVAETIPNTITVFSYSKEYGLAGERIGYLAISPDCRNKSELYSAMVLCNRILGFVCAPAFFQRVVKDLGGIKPDMTIYKENMEAMWKILQTSCLEIAKPQGAFFFFAKCPIDDDIEFCGEAIKFGLLFVPGYFFGGTGYCRISYSVPKETIIASERSFAKLSDMFS